MAPQLKFRCAEEQAEIEKVALENRLQSIHALSKSSRKREAAKKFVPKASTMRAAHWNED
jgi:hypothetical protein